MTRTILTAAATLLCSLALCGCGGADADADVPYRVGLNFISQSRTGGTPYAGKEALISELEDLGAGGYRQLTGSDVGWHDIYDGSGAYDDPTQYDWTDADELIMDGRLYPVPTLFQIGKDRADSWGVPDDALYTPDGDKLCVSQAAVKSAVEGYVTVVTDRYQDSTRHFEIANEVAQYNDYSAEDYADLIECCWRAMKLVNVRNQLVLGGLAGTSHQVFENHLGELEEVLAAGAGPYIDVVNFHYYDSWRSLQTAIDDLQACMEAHGMEDKPIWLTEVGRSHTAIEGDTDDGGNDDVPAHWQDDSEEEQAKDVFRLLCVAYGNGVDLVNWHTWVSGTDSSTPSSVWSGFGLRKAGSLAATKSWYSYQLFTQKLKSFSDCTAISQGSGGAWVYRFSTAKTSPSRGRVLLQLFRRWVLWSDSDAGVSYSLSDASGSSVSCTQVVPDGSGTFTTTTVDPDALTLTTTPLLVEQPLFAQAVDAARVRDWYLARKSGEEQTPPFQLVGDVDLSEVLVGLPSALR